MTRLELSVSNVGGIESLETAFDSGSTLIAAPNASNKTSLLKAIAFGLGADDISIRSGTSEAEVTLRLGGKEVTRTARKRGVGTEISGDPWLDDPEVRNQFSAVAALLEFNELRTAVRQGSNIETALKEPIDFDSLEQRRAALVEEKQSLQRELEQVSDVEARLETKQTELEEALQRRQELVDEVDTLEEKQEPETVDEEVESLRERRTELLNQKQQTLERIEATEDAIDSYREEQEEIEERIEELETEVESTDLESLRTERDRLQSDLEELTDRVDILQSVLTANREMLDAGYAGIIEKEHTLEGDEVSCWNCGTMTATTDIEQTHEELQELVKQEKSKRRDWEPAIDELDDKIDAARRAESKLDGLRGDRRSLSERIDERESSLETQSTRLEEIETELQNVTEELEEREAEREAENAEIADSIEETKLELQTVEREIERLESQISDLRADLERRKEITDNIDAITEQIETLTERLENMERRLREQFNSAMDDLLDALAFESIERIWLDGEFSVVVAREIGGTVQQDSVGNLAESERELVGLVLGLAGYLAYDLDESVPVLLLDSLGALDNERIEKLIEYIDDTPDFLIAAVHPDTAEGLESTEATVLKSPKLTQ